MLNFPCTLFQVLLYAAIVMVLIFPFDIFYFSSRYFFLRTLWRIVFPLQASLLLFGCIMWSQVLAVLLQKQWSVVIELYICYARARKEIYKHENIMLHSCAYHIHMRLLRVQFHISNRNTHGSPSIIWHPLRKQQPVSFNIR